MGARRSFPSSGCLRATSHSRPPPRSPSRDSPTPELCDHPLATRHLDESDDAAQCAFAAIPHPYPPKGQSGSYVHDCRDFPSTAPPRILHAGHGRRPAATPPNTAADGATPAAPTRHDGPAATLCPRPYRSSTTHRPSHRRSRQQTPRRPPDSTPNAMRRNAAAVETYVSGHPARSRCSSRPHRSRAEVGSARSSWGRPPSRSWPSARSRSFSLGGRNRTARLRARRN